MLMVVDCLFSVVCVGCGWLLVVGVVVGCCWWLLVYVCWRVMFVVVAECSQWLLLIVGRCVLLSFVARCLLFVDVCVFVDLRYGLVFLVVCR